ncbi:MAG: ATP synthase F1 subunit delta [Chlorobi bacterium]|nr:ATP synthase F1 subunit delta [Chlorobiota bacterium]
MATHSKAAKRYVKAFFDWARETGKLEEAARDMALIAETLENHPELADFLKSPVVTSKQKAEVLRGIFHDRTGAQIRRLLELLAEKDRSDILGDIARLFGEFYKQYQGIVDVTLTTAVPADEALQEAFLRKVKEITGKDKVELRTVTDPSIIGGYILQIGDLKVDDSVRGKLQKIKSKILVQ